MLVGLVLAANCGRCDRVLMTMFNGARSATIGTDEVADQSQVRHLNSGTH